MPKQFWARCFGLAWQSDIELEHFDPVVGPVDDQYISLRRVDSFEPREPKFQIGRAAIDDDGFRFSWNDEATFEFSGDAVRWMRGPSWTGTFPASFYSSVAAMVAASVGKLPLHVSSVILDDKAWLIAGKAGAGKSTLVAELLGAGGKLLADDLTILSLVDGEARATRGRPSIRLHPQSAELVRASKVATVPEDKRGKLLVWPVSRAEDKAWPIGGKLLLGGDSEQAISSHDKAVAYGSLVFRPKILAKLAGHAARRKMTLDLARHVPAIQFPTAQHFDEKDRRARIDAALRAIKAMSKAD